MSYIAASMLGALVFVSLAADPVLAVKPLDVTGAPPELGLALQSILEDDLMRVGAQVRTERDTKGKVRAAGLVVAGSVTATGAAGRIDLRVVSTADQALRGTATMTVKGGEWGANRAQLLTSIGVAAGLEILDPATPVYTPEQVLDWGRALAAGADAVAAFAKKWPDFGPAKRRRLK